MLFPPEIIEYTAESHFARHSKSTQIIYLLVLLALVSAIGITPFVKVNITTQSKGIIRSATENSNLQVAVYGQVVKNYLEENRMVLTGDTLLVLDTQTIQEQISAKKQKNLRNHAFIRDLSFALRYQPIKIEAAKYLSEYNEYLSQLNQQKLQSEYLLKEKQISDELFAKKVETKTDHDKLVNNYNASIKKEKLIHDQYHRQWNAELVQLQQENIELETTIAQLFDEMKKYVITSPVNGKIMQCSGIQAGSFIAPSQSLAQISPEGELLVECYVSPTDIGFFHLGMKVHFQLDAFNYNQWGTASGKVNEISGDIVTINDQPVFKVRCALNADYLQLKNGYKGELKKGMTLTGRFSLTERTLSQLLFDKVDNWLNPKLVSN